MHNKLIAFVTLLCALLLKTKQLLLYSICDNLGTKINTTVNRRMPKCDTVLQTEKDLFQREIRPKIAIFRLFSASKIPKYIWALPVRHTYILAHRIINWGMPKHSWGIWGSERYLSICNALLHLGIIRLINMLLITF